MRTSLHRREGRKGTASLDYVLIASIVSITIIAGSLMLGGSLTASYDSVATEVAAATGS